MNIIERAKKHIGFSHCDGCTDASDIISDLIAEVERLEKESNEHLEFAKECRADRDKGELFWRDTIKDLQSQLSKTTEAGMMALNELHEYKDQLTAAQEKCEGLSEMYDELFVHHAESESQLSRYQGGVEVEVWAWECTSCHHVVTSSNGYREKPKICRYSDEDYHCNHKEFIKLTGTYKRPKPQKVKRREQISECCFGADFFRDKKNAINKAIYAEWEE